MVVATGSVRLAAGEGSLALVTGTSADTGSPDAELTLPLGDGSKLATISSPLEEPGRPFGNKRAILTRASFSPTARRRASNERS